MSASSSAPSTPVPRPSRPASRLVAPPRTPSAPSSFFSVKNKENVPRRPVPVYLPPASSISASNPPLSANLPPRPLFPPEPPFHPPSAPQTRLTFVPFGTAASAASLPQYRPAASAAAARRGSGGGRRKERENVREKEKGRGKGGERAGEREDRPGMWEG
ncbi:hypothetical protein JCM10207_004003 [Rhodosporidiobolus poonsookiae]